MKRIGEIGEMDLRKMYEEGLSQQAIAEHYGVSRTTIWRKIREHNIDRRFKSGHAILAERNITISKEDFKFLYEEKKWSLRKIAEYFGVSDIFIRRRMKEFNIPTRKMDIFSDNSAIFRIHKINERFFDIWNQESAYIYGWIVGDGCIREGSVRFRVAKKDEDILYIIKNLFASDAPIKDEVGQDNYRAVSVYFNSVRLAKRVKELSYYNIPIELFSHFLRGFWEAEGSIFWHKSRNKKGGDLALTFSQKNKEILEYILTQLRKQTIINGGFLSNYKGQWKLFFSVNDSLSLYYFMYDGCDDMFLKRKKERYEELLERQLA